MRAWLSGVGTVLLDMSPVIWLALLAVYVVPAVIVIARRRTSNALWIILLNVFLGWTVFGWVAALLWSILDVRPPVVIQRCPSCKRGILATASKCRFCGSAIPPVASLSEVVRPLKAL